MRRFDFVRVTIVAALLTGSVSPVTGHEVERSGEQVESKACAILEGIVGEMFGTDPETITLRPSTPSGHDVCRAFWPIPGIDRDEQTRRALDNDLRDDNEISLTIMGTRFETTADAVASLESDVATLREGRTITVRGRERTIQREFGDWIDNLGDRAISTGNAVMVAAGTTRFTAAVSTTDDAAENLALGINVAGRIVQDLSGAN